MARSPPPTAPGTHPTRRFAPTDLAAERFVADPCKGIRAVIEVDYLDTKYRTEYATAETPAYAHHALRATAKTSLL